MTVRTILPWFVFLISFFLVLGPQRPLLYVPLVLTALGLFYLGYESDRLRFDKDLSQRRLRRFIRVGFGLLMAGAMVSFFVTTMPFVKALVPFDAILLLTDPLWRLGTVIAFGGVLRSKTKAPVRS